MVSEGSRNNQQNRRQARCDLDSTGPCEQFSTIRRISPPCCVGTHVFSTSGPRARPQTRHRGIRPGQNHWPFSTWLIRAHQHRPAGASWPLPTEPPRRPQMRNASSERPVGSPPHPAAREPHCATLQSPEAIRQNAGPPAQGQGPEEGSASLGRGHTNRLPASLLRRWCASARGACGGTGAAGPDCLCWRVPAGSARWGQEAPKLLILFFICKEAFPASREMQRQAGDTPAFHSSSAPSPAWTRPWREAISPQQPEGGER